MKVEFSYRCTVEQTHTATCKVPDDIVGQGAEAVQSFIYEHSELWKDDDVDSEDVRDLPRRGIKVNLP